MICVTNLSAMRMNSVFQLLSKIESLRGERLLIREGQCRTIFLTTTLMKN